MKSEVEVADVTVDDLELRDVTVGGHRVEPREADDGSRLVEADRINLDIEVAEVTVDARTIAGLGFREGTAGWYAGGLVEKVDVDVFR